MSPKAIQANLKIITILGGVFACNTLLASTSEHENLIPWVELIIPQIVNSTIFLGGLIYLLKNPVRNYFKTKAESFESAKKDAERAKLAAEETHIEVKKRLEALETSAQVNLATAKKDAEELKEKILSEAKAVASRIESEARRSAEHELQKAVFSLRTELLAKSMQRAEEEVKSRMTKDVQTDLQKSFVSRAQGLHL